MFGCYGGIRANEVFVVQFNEDVELVLTSSNCFEFVGFAEGDLCENTVKGVRIRTSRYVQDLFQFRIGNVRNCRSFREVLFGFVVYSYNGYVVSQGEARVSLNETNRFEAAGVDVSSQKVFETSSWTFTISPFNYLSSSSFLLITSDLDLSTSQCVSPYSCSYLKDLTALKVFLNSAQDSYTIQINSLKNPGSLQPIVFNITSFDPYTQDSVSLSYSLTQTLSLKSSYSLSSSLIKSSASLSLNLNFGCDLSYIDLIQITFPESFSIIDPITNSSTIKIVQIQTAINWISLILPDKPNDYNVKLEAFYKNYLVSQGSFNLSVICQSPCLDCLELPDKCLKCESFQPYLSGFKCFEQCPDGQTDIGDFVCSDCIVGCEKCQGFEKCVKCFSGYFLDEEMCVEDCPDGKYGNDGDCLDCSKNCLTCEGDLDYCTSCKQGLVIYGTTCTSRCPGLLINQVCYDCIDCATCAGSIYNCTSCKSGSYLYQSKCTATCPSGTLPQSTSCSQCSSVCRTCQKSTSQCTSCYEGSELSGSTCISSCPTSYYYKEGSCLACHSACQSCKNSADYCTSCTSGYAYKGECLSECPQSYTIKSDSICLDCLETCETCNQSISRCTSCRSPLLIHNSSCLSSCPEGFFNSSGLCDDCSGGCKVCNESECLICNENFILFNGFCLDQCPEGLFLQAGRCVNCSNGCQNCFNASQCLDCLVPYLALDGSCTLTCPEGFVPEARLCAEVVCASNCTFALLNNSVCDPECDYEECEYDDEHCEHEEKGEIRIQDEPFSITTASVFVSVVAGAASLLTAGSVFMTTAPVLATFEYAAWVAEASVVLQDRRGRRLIDSYEDASKACFVGILIVLVGKTVGNLLALRKYWKLKKDEKHSKWLEGHYKFWVCVVGLSAVFSYKIVSIFTCGVLGSSYFSADFSGPSDFYRILFIFTAFDLILFTVPMLCICIYVLSIYPEDSFTFILTADVFIVTVLSILLSIISIILYSRRVKASKAQSRMVSIAVPTAFEDIDFTSEGMKSGNEDRYMIIRQYLNNLRNFEKLGKTRKLAKCRSLDLTQVESSSNQLSSSFRHDRLNETLNEKFQDNPSVLIHSVEYSQDSELSISSIRIDVDREFEDKFKPESENDEKVVERKENNEKMDKMRKMGKMDNKDNKDIENFEVLEVDQDDFEVVKVRCKDIGKVICLKKSFDDGIFVDEDFEILDPQPHVNFDDLEFVLVRTDNPGIGIFRSRTTGEEVRVLRTFTHAKVVKDGRRSANYEFILNSRRELIENSGVKDGHPLFWKFENPKVQRRDN